MNISLLPFAPEDLVSRDGFGSPVPRQPAHLHTQAESDAYFLDSSKFPRRGPILFKPPYAIGSVPSLSGHAIVHTVDKKKAFCIFVLAGCGTIASNCKYLYYLARSHKSITGYHAVSYVVYYKSADRVTVGYRLLNGSTQYVAYR